MTTKNGKGYVTCWGDSSLKIIDLTSMSITKSIRMGAGPEKMLMQGNFMYVTNSGMYGIDSTISVINLTTETISKTIVAGYNPEDIKLDKNSDLWVLCFGKEVYDASNKLIDSSACELVRINTDSWEVEHRVTISNSEHALILDISPDGSLLYFGGGYSFAGIYSLSISQIDNPPLKYCDDYAYGFNVNPNNGEVFVTIAGNYVDAGLLKRYSAQGNLLGTYQAGIIPRSTFFINN
jgi:DNA-binding beta-propeller fold protein YncE